FIFSKPWYKYSQKRTSYYIEYSKKNWHEANESCNAFPVKSTLLQSIRNLEEYSEFKVLLRQAEQQLSGTSYWWMNLFQEGDSLKWLTSPEESPTFVDWEVNTDFYMNRSAGVVVLGLGVSWSLKNITSRKHSICEIQGMKDSHDTAVYIEDRTGVQNESDDVYEVFLKCVPSGWFLWGSIIWFKDGTAISTETSQQFLNLTLKAPFTMESISEFQGYYYCSVELDRHSK
ncbi:unnamed protein product, partial [Larinioides sclopetarius]